MPPPSASLHISLVQMQTQLKTRSLLPAVGSAGVYVVVVGVGYLFIKPMCISVLCKALVHQKSMHFLYNYVLLWLYFLLRYTAYICDTIELLYIDY